MSRYEMRRAARFAALVLLAAALLALGRGVQAQDDEEPFTMAEVSSEAMAVESRVEFGLLFNNEESYQYGDYTGLDEDEFYFLGNMDLRRRGAYDSSSPLYWRLRAANLGLDSRRVRFDYGEQGRYGLALEFRELPKLQEDTTLQFMGGNGSRGLTLPPGWVDGPTTADLTTLSSSAGGLNVDHERERWRGEFSFLLSDALKFRSSFSRETKQGTKLTGAMIAASGGNPRASIVPEPIDYDTRQLDVGFEYGTDNAQLAVGYYMSWFENRKDSLTWQNPFSGVGAWDVEAFSPAPGTKGTAPDNRFDQVTLDAGYSLPAHSRVTLNAAFGRMQQDDSFLPYTSNPLLAAPIGLPRGSLDGKIDTTFLKLGLNSRPVPKLTLNASYRYDDRDNRTSRAMYTYVVADAADQDTSAANSSQRLNLPYSYRENELELWAKYRVWRRTDVKLEYQHEEIDRNFTAVDTVREDRFGIDLITRPTDFLSGRFHLGRATRDGSSYVGNAPYLASHNPAFTGGVGFENDPLLRRFHLADRDRSELMASLTLMPTETLSIDLRADYVDEDYDHTEVGLTDRRTQSYTADVSFTPNDWLRGYAFFTREEVDIDQDGHSFRGFAAAADLADPGRHWTLEEDDVNDTIGFGLEAQVIPEKLGLSFEYLFSRSRVDIDPENGVTLGPAESFPYDLVERLHNARVAAKYELREGISLELAYVFEKFDRQDWGVDKVGLSTTSQVIQTAEGAPDDRGSLVALSVVYTFQ